MVSFKQLLGAESATSAPKFSFYMPNMNSRGKIIDDIEDWVLDYMDTITKINGGCTTIPNLPATWKPDKNHDTYIVENTYLVYSLIFDVEHFLENFHKVKAFIYKFGRDTQQNALLIEIDGTNKLGIFERKGYLIRRAKYKNAPAPLVTEPVA